MVKNTYTDISMKGAAALVDAIVKDPSVDRSVSDAIALVYIEGKDTTNGLTTILTKELGDAKSKMNAHGEAINMNTSSIKKQGEEMKALHKRVESSSTSSNQHLFASEMGERVDEAHSKIDAHDEAINVITSSIEIQREGMKALTERLQSSSTSSNQHLFATEFGTRVLQCLPVCFDGPSGITPWVPVYENGHDYVVLSKTIAEQVIKCMVTTTADLKIVLDSLAPATAFTYNIGSNPNQRTLFMNIMKKTPFGVKKLPSAKWTKNFEIYRIIDADYFKGVMKDIATNCPSRPLALPEHVKKLKIHKRYFPLTMSMCSGVGNDVKYVNMAETLTPDDLSRMPSWGMNWWCESYASGAERYFGMEEVNGRLGHVQSGTYVPPEGCMYARSYEVTLDAYIKLLEEFQTKQKAKKRARVA